jgi:hypothetical protein
VVGKRERRRLGERRREGRLLLYLPEGCSAVHTVTVVALAGQERQTGFSIRGCLTTSTREASFMQVFHGTKVPKVHSTEGWMDGWSLPYNQFHSSMVLVLVQYSPVAAVDAAGNS